MGAVRDEVEYGAFSSSAQCAGLITVPFRLGESSGRGTTSGGRGVGSSCWGSGCVLGVVFGRGGEVDVRVYEFVGRAMGISISTLIRAERIEEEGIDALLGLHDCIVYAFAGDGGQGSETGALGF